MAFRCEQCDREFSSEAGLAQHNSDKHGIGKESKQEKELEQQIRREKRESELEKSLSAKKTKRIAKYSVALIIIVVLLYFVITSIPASPISKLREGLGPVGSQHVHSDFKVYLNGALVDFSIPKYQVNPNRQHVHMEGGDGDVVHLHATGIKTGFFFSTLGIAFNSTCIAMDTGRAYCNNANNTLKFYVNNEPNSEFEMYMMKSLDNVLVSYGNEANLTSQLESVTTKARGIDSGQVTIRPH